MTIADVHDYIFFILDKAKQDMVSHEWIDSSLHSAQLSRFSELLPAQSEQGRAPVPVSQIEYGVSTNAMDFLFPFKKKKDFFQDDTEKGLLKLESDYAHLRALYVLSYNNKYERASHRGVSILSENQLAERLSSQIIMPTDRNPVGIMIYDGGKAIQIYPQKGFSGRYYYFSTPVKPRFAYTVDGLTETQDLDNSVDMVWDDESQNAIIWKALQPLGINIDDTLAVQWAQSKEQKGS